MDAVKVLWDDIADEYKWCRKIILPFTIDDFLAICGELSALGDSVGVEFKMMDTILLVSPKFEVKAMDMRNRLRDRLKQDDNILRTRGKILHNLTVVISPYLDSDDWFIIENNLMMLCAARKRG